MIYKFLPFRSGVHRVAGIALFRALLAKCRSAPLETEVKDAIQNVVRRRFKRNRLQCSKRLLCDAFREGYQAINLLDAAAEGDEESIVQIREILDMLPPAVKQPTPASPLLKVPEPPKPKQPKGPQTTLHLRPYRNVSGIRQVPRLVYRGPLPFLRLTKPQPLSLTGYIARVHKTRDKRVSQNVKFRDYNLPLAQREDEWDLILSKEYPDPGDGKHPGSTPNQKSWANTLIENGINFIDTQLGWTAGKRHAKALELWEIQKKEQILADLEAKVRRTQTRIRALGRRLESPQVDAEPNVERLAAKKAGLEKKLEDIERQLELKKDEFCVQ